MKFKRVKYAAAALAAISVLTVSAPRQSHAIAVGATAIGGVIATASVAFLIYHEYFEYRYYHRGNTGLAVSALFVGLILDEHRSSSVDEVSVESDLLHYDRNVAAKIRRDLQVLDMESDPKVVKVAVPQTIRRFLDGGYPSLEKLESAECGLVTKVQQVLSEDVSKTRFEKLGIKKPYQIDLSTAQYLLEKWPGGFETELSVEEIQERQQAGTCEYHV